ncbi:MAG: hypothetical protein R3D30_14615 [Hyphomicrobiales bacterium]
MAALSARWAWSIWNSSDSGQHIFLSAFCVFQKLRGRCNYLSKFAAVFHNANALLAVCRPHAIFDETRRLLKPLFFCEASFSVSASPSIHGAVRDFETMTDVKLLRLCETRDVGIFLVSDVAKQDDRTKQDLLGHLEVGRGTVLDSGLKRHCCK